VVVPGHQPGSVAVAVQNPDGQIQLLPAAYTYLSDTFTVMLLPDTQNMTSVLYGGTMDMLNAEMHWIVDNAASENIRAVIGLGDISDCAAESDFVNADGAYASIDAAGLPYAAIIGNHDYTDPYNVCGRVGDRTSDRYNAHFGPSRFVAHPFYGTSNWPPGKNDNYYVTFEVGALKYLILALEFVPRDDTLVWAQSVISAFPDRYVILATHAFMASDTARRSIQTDFGPGLALQGNYNAGEDMWQKLVRKNRNVVLAVGGHFSGAPTHRQDTADAGNVVAQECVDYQDDGFGGDGRSRQLVIHPFEGWLEARSCSAWAGDCLTDAINAFTEPLSGFVQSAPDTTPPLVWITAPTTGAVLFSSQRFAGIAGTLPGDAAAVTVRIYAGSTATGTPVASVPATPGTWGPFAVTGPALPDGTYTAQLEQLDAAGNLGKSAAVTYTVSAAKPYPAAVFADAPLAYWRLDEASGTTAADGMGGSSGIYLNGVTLAQPGALANDPDPSAWFDGVNDTVRVPSTLALAPTAGLTLEAWLDPTSLPSTSASIVRKEQSYMLRVTSTGALFFRIWTADGNNHEYQSAANVIAPNQWTHVVGTWDGASMVIYANGVPVGSRSQGGALGANSNELYIGCGLNSYDYFNGSIDEVAVYDHPLTAARVQAHWAAAH
jgi:hypothetical protein